MYPLPIVKDLNVFEERPGGIRSGPKVVQVHTFLLQQAVPGLAARIVPAVPLPAHTGRHRIGG